MTDGDTIGAASRRLALALDALAAAVARREAARGDHFAEEIHVLGADRARLASDLDAAMAHTRALETTNREIARRLDVAIGTIRSMLDDHVRDNP